MSRLIKMHGQIIPAVPPPPAPPPPPDPYTIEVQIYGPGVGWGNVGLAAYSSTYYFVASHPVPSVGNLAYINWLWNTEYTPRQYNLDTPVSFSNDGYRTGVGVYCDYEGFTQVTGQIAVMVNDGAGGSGTGFFDITFNWS